MKVCLFTHTFPFGKNVEAFIENELAVAAHLDANITIVPLRREKGIRALPSNVTVCCDLADTDLWVRMKCLCKLIFSKAIWHLRRSSDPPQNIGEFLKGAKYLYAALLVEAFITKHTGMVSDMDVLYSYWFNHTPMGLFWGIRNSRIKKPAVMTRAHGYDVYERAIGSYIPYRDETLKSIDMVFAISEYGCKYMCGKYPVSKEKITVSKLGVLPIEKKHGQSSDEDKSVSLVSCSNVVYVKRVSLILRSILRYAETHPELKISWTHIGGGVNYDCLRQEVEEIKSRNTVPNLCVTLTGVVSNTQVREIYSEKHFDCFINLSESEGIPVSIMECISAGIPVLACDVGGMKEIVTEETGLLLDKDFHFEDFSLNMDKILSNKEYYKKSVSLFFSRNYDAERNYTDFYNRLFSLSHENTAD